MFCGKMKNGYQGIIYCDVKGVFNEKDSCLGCQYYKEPKAILCIDFDGTIVKDDFPEIGKPLDHAPELISRLYDMGYYIIIWTSRDKQKAAEAEKALQQLGVKYHSINESNRENVAKYGGDTRKIYADAYIDDKNIGQKIWWPELFEMILAKFEQRKMVFEW